MNEVNYLFRVVEVWYQRYQIEIIWADDYSRFEILVPLSLSLDYRPDSHW